MFALQEHRSIAGVVSIIVHAAVVATAIAGAAQGRPAAPPMVIVPESLLIVPTGTPARPVGRLAAPVIAPVDVPDLPGMPALPGIPSAPKTWLPPTGLGGVLPTGLGGAAGDIVDPVLTDEPPVLLSAPVPAYPPLLRQAGIQGWVTVQTVVDTMGRAETASLRVVNSPNPGFDRPALDCVRRALFRPGRVHGRAVRVLVRVPLHFMLRP
jgi:TonB family protein